MATTATSSDPFSGYKNLAVSPPASGGGGSGGAGGLAPQPVSGANDSLTAFFRSLTNLTGNTGANQFNAGGSTINTGLGTVGTGLEAQNVGLTTLNAPIDFYTKLLSGDPTTMTQALAPTASLLGKQYAAQTNATNQGTPQGGFRSTVLAGLPFAETGAVGNAALGLQNQAATALGQLGGEQAGIGQGMSQTGLGVAGVGSTQQSQGLQAIFQTIQALLGKMGINLQGAGVNSFATFAGALDSLIGA